jgi:hypothetical protein
LFADEWLVRGEGGQGKLAWYALAPGLAGTALARQPVPMLSDAQGNLICTLPDAEGLRTTESEPTQGTLPTLCPGFAHGERAKLDGGISKGIPASEGTLPTFPEHTYQAPREDGHRIVDGPSKAGVQEVGDGVVQPSLIDLRRPQIGAGCSLSSHAPSATAPAATSVPDRGCGSLSLAAPAGLNGAKITSGATQADQVISLSPPAVPPATDGVAGNRTGEPPIAL